MDVFKKFMAEELKEKDHKDLKKVISHKAKSISKKNEATKSKPKLQKDKIEKTGKKVGKVARVMEEFAEKKLRSGSKKGPLVTNAKQALAIGYSEKKRASKKKGK